MEDDNLPLQSKIFDISDDEAPLVQQMNATKSTASQKVLDEKPSIKVTKAKKSRATSIVATEKDLIKPSSQQLIPPSSPPLIPPSSQQVIPPTIRRRAKPAKRSKEEMQNMTARVEPPTKKLKGWKGWAIVEENEDQDQAKEEVDAEEGTADVEGDSNGGMKTRRTKRNIKRN
ncbi:hypothetical protein DFH28DRAFT_937725 [Melampsora americana]|nr:hypothetical protein DFH28DRAFT_937725 [Melampsora americana]